MGTAVKGVCGGLKMSPQSSSPSRISMCDLFGNKVFVYMFKVRIELGVYWIRVGSKFCGCLYKRQKRTHRDKHKGEGQWDMVVETGVMHTQAKECQGLPAGAEAKRKTWTRLSP